jgi:hypothetical protein
MVRAGREEEALGGVERDALTASQWWYGLSVTVTHEATVA